MLLTTVVPIIPEYLLRLEHPNDTDFLLHNEPMAMEVRMKRAAENDYEEMYSDEAWDVPMPNNARINADRNPLKVHKGTTAPPASSRRDREGRRRGKTPRLKTTTEETPGEEEEGQSGRSRMQPARPPDQPFHSSPDINRHEVLAKENVQVGLMFGSKALIQLLVNPWIGPLTNKIGYTMPMFGGFIIMFTSTLLFAFGDSFPVLWFARAMQGVGSACTSTSGMGMLAQAYPDDLERGSAMGIALGGLALGVLVGPPYGGILYQWAGKELPFILLALLAVFDGSLQFAILQPKIDRGEPEGSSIKQLAKDPYIVIAAGAITIGNLGIAMLEPSLPLWMMESWGANSFERGAAFLPASISYLVGTNIFGPLAHKMGRWLSGFIGLIVIGFSLLAIPSAESVGGLVIPNGLLGFAIGMIDASMFPLMGYLVDIRHVGVYGSIYAIADAAFCFAFALGPFFSGPLVRGLGFPTMMYLIAVITFIYAPLMFLLKSPPVLTGEQHVVSTTANGTGTSMELTDGKYETIEGKNVSRNEQYDYQQAWND